ncbi:MAG: hypothetical protein EOO22_13300 [Comamonadaceae bacterium]|nr:MAG: hypothetical protein EOO22_13300 [Comamonadaceae bacterium]
MESVRLSAPEQLQKTPLHALHLELGARMVPFAGYSMPVQYPAGLMAEHLHTRSAAGLFDVSHMGQLQLVGPDAAAAFETLMPVDVIGLGVDRQRYGLLLTDAGTIIDDLMFVNRGDHLFVIVNGACKAGDIAHMQRRIGEVTSGLLGPSVDKPVAMAYVDTGHATIGTRVDAIVRGKRVPMEVAAMPFTPNRYHRG